MSRHHRTGARWRSWPSKTRECVENELVSVESPGTKANLVSAPPRKVPRERLGPCPTTTYAAGAVRRRIPTICGSKRYDAYDRAPGEDQVQKVFLLGEGGKKVAWDGHGGSEADWNLVNSCSPNQTCTREVKRLIVWVTFIVLQKPQASRAQSRGELNRSSDGCHVYFGNLGFGCSGFSRSSFKARFGCGKTKGVLYVPAVKSRESHTFAFTTATL